MSMYRNRYFFLGILLLLIGIQFRMVESFVLNEKATRALARISKESTVADNSGMGAMLMQIYPNPTKRVAPPRWLGLSMIAIGAVISCHALAIPSPQRQE
ncbi:MAG: hypothetical protein P8L85_08800 [Rubripirellula sp.]|nr:hypothetical protein [Rubripirellula sp.]